MGIGETGGDTGGCSGVGVGETGGGAGGGKRESVENFGVGIGETGGGAGVAAVAGRGTIVSASCAVIGAAFSLASWA